MKSKIMKQKETETVFSRRNYIILLIGSVVIIVGYLFMSGEGSTPAAYNPDIFSGPSASTGIHAALCAASLPPHRHTPTMPSVTSAMFHRL